MYTRLCFVTWSSAARWALEHQVGVCSCCLYIKPVLLSMCQTPACSDDIFPYVFPCSMHIEGQCPLWSASRWGNSNGFQRNQVQESQRNQVHQLSSCLACLSAVMDKLAVSTLHTKLKSRRVCEKVCADLILCLCTTCACRS